MPPVDGNVFLLILDPLEALGVPYFVTGSVAAMLYGEPRLTHDVDLVVELDRDFDTHRFEDAYPIDRFYCPPAEVIDVERARMQRGHFNIIHHETGFKADVYLLGNDPLHRWALAERRRLDVEGHGLWVAAPEYVIARKLQYLAEGGSPKHASDIAAMLRLTSIDRALVEEKAMSLGLRDLWRRVSES